MPEVLDIERSSFEHSWTEEDFLSSLRQRHCIGMVVELNEEIIGFMIYELHKISLRVLNFAVAEQYRRNGIGVQMIQKLVDKLSQQRRSEIELTVRETNLSAQLFFQSQGFKAVQVLRSHYHDTDEDAYLMRYQLMEAPDWLPFEGVRNRLTAYKDAA
ncbi:MAG: ribosomal protein S18-alanine N-acetyltransferase [Planctomycetaceae bacterium]|nr:ribosomal protein S18-alanine N-acetyltransferase [Planctomycetaceae bacterium]